ncbi:Uncharacterised protein [Segatella copri]|nr:Uncharacterised protein [Segatella copri]
MTEPTEETAGTEVPKKAEPSTEGTTTIFLGFSKLLTVYNPMPLFSVMADRDADG